MGRHKHSEKAERVRRQEAELDSILAHRAEAEALAPILEQENETLERRHWHARGADVAKAQRKRRRRGFA